MKQDIQLFELIKKEAERQKGGLELIASENYVSEDVLKAMEMSSSELWDITTHIETIENSQIADYIDGAFYDLQGRRLNARPQRGLYIQGGKMRMAW